MANWNRPDIPHKGWRYVGIEDLGDRIPSNEEIPYEQCDMCGNDKIRYIHILEHPNYPHVLHVGCDCASNMVAGYVNPRENERNLKNRSNRKENFLRQPWAQHPISGNYILRYKGEIVTIMKSKYNNGLGVVYRGQSIWKYNGNIILDFDTAKLAAFDMFDKINHK